MATYDIVTDTAQLTCNQGTTPSNLLVTSQDFITIGDNKPIATTEDNKPNANIKPFGKCRLQPTSNGFLPCIPQPIKWQKVAYGNEINDMPMLINASFCRCAVGGKITFKDRGHTENHFIEIDSFPEDEQDQLKNIADRVNGEDEREEIKSCYLTTEDGEILEEVLPNMYVYLHLHTQNMIGQNINIDLYNSKIDFLYKDKPLQNDILQNFLVTKNEEIIELKVVKP